MHYLAAERWPPNDVSAARFNIDTFAQATVACARKLIVFEEHMQAAAPGLVCAGMRNAAPVVHPPRDRFGMLRGI
jgi:hypothetical protein